MLNVLYLYTTVYSLLLYWKPRHLYYKPKF